MAALEGFCGGLRRHTPIPVPYLRCLYKRMSLKAKLEAVIYAAEEPVTLAQFASLFAEDALAWKAEQAARQLELAQSVESAAEADGELLPTDSTGELADLLDAIGQEAPSEETPAEAAITEPSAADAE